MSRLRQTEFLAFLQKHRRSLVLIIEDRVSKGYKEYGIENQAEFINFTNPHDDCLWDAIIPGYDYKIEPDTRHLTRGLFGYIRVPGGNHKIIVDLKLEGFSYERFLDDLAKYIYYYNHINDVEVSLVLFNKCKL